jgi:hypothetical protein
MFINYSDVYIHTNGSPGQVTDERMKFVPLQHWELPSPTHLEKDFEGLSAEDCITEIQSLETQAAEYVTVAFEPLSVGPTKTKKKRGSTRNL